MAAARAQTGRRGKAERQSSAERPSKVEQPSKAESNGVKDEDTLRRAVLETARAMSREGLTPGRSGNVSARWQEGMLITPSGLPYEAITSADIVRVGPRGEVAEGAPKPSSEWRFHLAAYRTRPDAMALVHTHSLHATALAAAHKPIPAFHYMVAVAGGDDIPLVPYALFGSEALAQHVAKGLEARNACLLANHGVVAIGPSLAAALELAREVETLAAQYLKVLSLGKGSVHLLSKKEMAAVKRRFADYGQ